jgi:hypothetical protein
MINLILFIITNKIKRKFTIFKEEFLLKLCIIKKKIFNKNFLFFHILFNNFFIF